MYGTGRVCDSHPTTIYIRKGHLLHIEVVSHVLHAVGCYVIPGRKRLHVWDSKTYPSPTFNLISTSLKYASWSVQMLCRQIYDDPLFVGSYMLHMYLRISMVERRVYKSARLCRVTLQNMLSVRFDGSNLLRARRLHGRGEKVIKSWLYLHNNLFHHPAAQVSIAFLSY